MSQKIYALVDCDSFFVACEQAFDEKLQNRPVCVLSNNMGCVVARSKEAKKVGVEMGMPYFMAKKKFPDVVYVRGDLEKYAAISKNVIAIIRQFSPNVEQYSIDEAFIELSGIKKLHKKNYFKIAEEIRARIKNELDISVSIGVSLNKTLAKIASHRAKMQVFHDVKNAKGVYLIGSSKIERELAQEPISEIWGIGRRLNKKMNDYGIHTALEFAQKDEEWVKKKFGKNVYETYGELQGRCLLKIEPAKKLPKSIQFTRSFGGSCGEKEKLKNELKQNIEKACLKLRHKGAFCSGIGVMLKTKDFHVVFDKIAFDEATNLEILITKHAFALFEKLYMQGFLYRSTGIVLQNLTYKSNEQLTLFHEETRAEKNKKLTQAIVNIERKFGRKAISTGMASVRTLEGDDDV